MTVGSWMCLSVPTCRQSKALPIRGFYAWLVNVSKVLWDLCMESLHSCKALLVLLNSVISVKHDKYHPCLCTASKLTFAPYTYRKYKLIKSQMITPVTFTEQTHCVTFMKSGGSNARKKCGLCQKLSRALNHITTAPKYHQPKQFNQQSKIILNQVKQFQLFFP